MKRLIVNADDLGLSKSVNEGIARAFREGIVTFISVLPTGDAFDDAARIAKELALKEIGAHLALTETTPLLDRASVGTLTAKDGRFFKGYGQFLPRYLLGMIDKGRIYAELKAQMDALHGLNIPITNMSSHEHIHMLPGILRIFTGIAREYKIPSVRFPCAENARGEGGLNEKYRALILAMFAAGMKNVLKDGNFYRPENFLGFIHSGRLSEATLLSMVNDLKEGTTEIVCHPGYLSPEVLDTYPWHKGCEEELFALTSTRVRKAIEERGITLVGYDECLSSR